MSDRKPLVGGNWKMNGTFESCCALARSVADGLLRVHRVEAAVFPPFPYLKAVGAVLRERGSRIELGAQDLCAKSDGAFTGEVSASMLKDCGVAVVLAGHSERRHVFGEKDEQVNAKVRAALEAGLKCILCVGETLEQRESGHTDPVNQRQIRAGLADVREEWIERLSIAYEPVWAIGTGRTASPEDAQDAHSKIRRAIAAIHGPSIAERVRILYGGSVTAVNAAALFTGRDVDGGLIGGASLKPGDFVEIVKAAAASRAGSEG